jgi:small subunit ribosomal protein S3
MGQKVNPVGFRLVGTKNWKSQWISKKHYVQYLREDVMISDHIDKNLGHGAVGSIGIQRSGEKVKVEIWTARPGIVIGRKGQDIDRLKEELQNMTNREVSIDIKEIKKPELNAVLSAKNISEQLLKRVNFRRAMKSAVSFTMGAGAEGVKVACSGRLGGAEMCRTEWYKEGRIPLHTMRADIDYACVESKTRYGIIGVKVWICKSLVRVEEGA